MAAACALAPTISAGDVVQFQDGRFVRVEHHEIHGAYAKLDFGNGTLWMPRERIEHISRAGLVVYGERTDRPREIYARADRDRPRRRSVRAPETTRVPETVWTATLDERAGSRR